MGIVPNPVKVENSIPKEVPPVNNLVPQIGPPVAPVLSPYPFQDYRFYHPLLYQQPRPFLFNIPPAVSNIVPSPAPQITPLTNGFNQPMRMINPSIVVPPRPVTTTAQPLQLTKPVQAATVSNAPIQPCKPSSAQSSNKLIQFMNNVHFPEPNVLNDCINLLPQNMSLADMLLQPPNLQERWYNYLKETTGLEAAEKFKYLLHTTNQKGLKVLDKNIFERSTPQSCESPTFNWYDSPTNQINFNKPVYMTENVLNDPHNHSQTNGLLSKQNAQFVKTIANGLSSKMTEAEIQRHINEEFANLSINSSDINDVFQAFAIKSDQTNGFPINEGQKVTGPRFYKYFQ
ncbi:hypothetical protein NQ317_018074 [Molorchus minor]|uniref:Uncharacterized protein n=1 Tax=Molorchus minor TaxID=1323400 RepID=A0ABQ9JG42_9CUCU|nr:hypothetical protein NQ317_018074 [Molorchus minor]